jgi:Amt family ammonium transporter
MKHLRALLLACLAFALPVAGQTDGKIEAKLDTIIQKLDRSQGMLEEVAKVVKKEAAPATPAAAPATDVAAKAEIEAVQVNVNTVWMIVTGALVFLMQAGFAMVELGFSRAKNSINIIMKNFLDFSHQRDRLHVPGLSASCSAPAPADGSARRLLALQSRGG